MSLVKLRTQLVLLINSVDPVILARGRNESMPITSAKIFQQSDAHWVELEVLGTKMYKVHLGETRKVSECSCPFFERNRQVCKHMVAGALRSLQLIKGNEIPVFQRMDAPKTKELGLDDLLKAIASHSNEMTFPKWQKTSVDPLVHFYTMDFEEGVSPEWSLVPLLGEWDGQCLQNAKRLRMRDLQNSPNMSLGMLDKALLDMTPQSYRMNGIETPRQIPYMLSIFRDYPKLLHPKTNRNIHVESGFWRIRLLLVEKDGDYQFVGRMVQGDEIRTWENDSVSILGDSEKCVFIGHTLFAFDQGSWKDSELNFLIKPIHVPREALSSTLRKLRMRQDIVDVPEKYLPQVILGEPRPAIHLSWLPHREELHAILLFQYQPDEAFRLQSRAKYEILSQDLQGNDIILQSGPDQEDAHVSLVCSLMRVETWKAFIARDSGLTLDLMSASLFIREVIEPLQKKADFLLVGLENLKRFAKHPAQFNLSVNSGIDWFDLQGEVTFGEHKTNLNQLLQMDWDDDEVVLPDGSKGILSRDLLRLLRVIQGIHGKQESNQSLRISHLHVAVIESLLENKSVHISQRDELKKRLLERAKKIVEPKPVPSTLQATLRPYQLEGLHWLRQMRAWGCGGILADDMGLGKTVQVIALLCDFYLKKTEHRPSLIVLPTSLLHNWKQELTRFAPHLTVMIFHGMERIDKMQLTDVKGCVILTSYTLLRNELETWQDMELGCLVLDESQAIKNPQSQSAIAARSLQAEYRLAMTGTPIENNLMDLWSQFAFVNPGLLGGKDFFRKEFMGNGKEPPPRNLLDLLGRITAPFYLRRTKEKVLTDLPPLDERILYVDMTNPQRVLYEKTKNHYRKKILGEIQEKGIRKSQIYILEGMLRLRQIACDPRLYLQSSKAPSAKLELLVEKLQEELVENHKALVFSQFTTLLGYCGQALQAAKIDFAYLDGSTQNRAKVIEEFTKQSSKRVFLISLKAGGTGLNLTTADYVFHLDPWWNPAVESQATGRAHRIGQKNVVQSIKLVASNSIEEKILQLQESKRQLASAVLQSDQGFVKNLDLDMVRELFT